MTDPIAAALRDSRARAVHDARIRTVLTLARADLLIVDYSGATDDPTIVDALEALNVRPPAPHRDLLSYAEALLDHLDRAAIIEDDRLEVLYDADEVVTLTAAYGGREALREHLEQENDADLSALIGESFPATVIDPA